MAVFSVRNSALDSFCISVLLLLILLQMVTSLVYFAGVFIFSSEVLISPLLFCQTNPHGEVTCIRWHRSSPDEADSKIDVIITTLLTLCFYLPLVLVAFGMLAMLLAAYGKDRTIFQFSMACQATSSVLTLTGIVAFLFLYQSYVRWKDLTIWFHLCVGVQVELVLTTVITVVAGKSLTPDWE